MLRFAGSSSRLNLLHQCQGKSEISPHDASEHKAHNEAIKWLAQSIPKMEYGNLQFLVDLRRVLR